MLTFPPHTSHKLQIFDVGVYGPFKKYCAIQALKTRAFKAWMALNPGKIITIKQIGQLIKQAFQSAFTYKNITKSFDKPGF